MIEQADVALPKLKKFALAQFTQHPVYMDRGKAKGVREIVLGQRAFKAAISYRTNSLQTRRQFEQ